MIIFNLNFYEIIEAAQKENEEEEEEEGEEEEEEGEEEEEVLDEEAQMMASMGLPLAFGSSSAQKRAVS